MKIPMSWICLASLVAASTALSQGHEADAGVDAELRNTIPRFTNDG